MQEAAQAMNHADDIDYEDRYPFYSVLMKIERQKKKEACNIPIRSTLTMDDCPDGFNISQFTLSKLQELRNARIDKEIESKYIAKELGELTRKLDDLVTEEAYYNNLLLHDIEIEKLYKADLKELETNFEIILLINQGQDEVSISDEIISYTDSLFLPTSVVEKFNIRIRELGEMHVHLLDKVMKNRKKISMIEWEVQKLSLQAVHLNEYYTDLQVFRVTRDMQRILSEGSDKSSQTTKVSKYLSTSFLQKYLIKYFVDKERLEKVNKRKEFVSQGIEEKKKSLQKVRVQFEDKIEKAQKELELLTKEVEDLQMTTAEMDNEVTSLPNEQLNTTNPLVMKFAVARSQLHEKTRLQKEEIAKLQQELEKTRLKTFPTFSKASYYLGKIPQAAKNTK
jgi:hypothetical protein